MRRLRLAASLLSLTAMACAGPRAPAPGAGGLALAPTARVGSALREGAPQVRRLGRRGWVEATALVTASEVESPANARERALAEGLTLDQLKGDAPSDPDLPTPSSVSRR